MLQIIPSAIVAPVTEWSGPRHLVVLNRGSSSQRVAVLTKTGRFSVRNADEGEAAAYSSPCEHIVFEVPANTHRKLLLHLEPRTGTADDRVPGLIPVVCVGSPDASVIAVASLECSSDSNDGWPPWGSPAAQLLHSYDVPEGRIIQLLRQGKNAAAPRSFAPSVDMQHLSSCQFESEDAGEGQVVPDVCMAERQSDARQSCTASFRSELNSVSCTDQLAIPPVFQAVQIEIEGRHAVVKKVIPVPPNSRASSQMSSRPNCSRTSSRGSASSMATSAVSGLTTASFQIGGKWYDARGNEVKPEDEWMDKGRASVGGMQSVCGQRVSSGCDEAMTSIQGECTIPEAQNDINHLKSAALAAASAALGIGLSELPEPASFRAPSFLPMLCSEATVPKAEFQASSRVTEGCSSAVSDSKLLSSRQTDVRGTRRVAGVTKKSSPGKQAPNLSQLSQSQIDANWDSL